MCEVSRDEEKFLIGSFEFMEITLQDAIDDDRSEWLMCYMCSFKYEKREMFVNCGIINLLNLI